ncbi:MAG TPA: type I citrate synthase [Bdellovibrionales bacterium]|nr:MAG: type I citrate synthase [Bdellovibrionales bacterium GWA1_52_35]HAR44065.1 type I citrate synthase [Bdellovibrionales bacterium]HCM40784.1 citrate (Si)-synthase [Bdellovibrionales bacterium]
MSSLKAKLSEKIKAHKPRIQKLMKEQGNTVIDQVTIEQCIGGARDIRCLVTDISYLDPQEGIRFRGKTIPETFAALPKVPGCEYPYVEGFWSFLLTGEIPTMEETMEIVKDWKTRAKVPSYVFDVLRAMPKDSHPMAMLSTAVLAMQKESVFAKKYAEGMKKDEYWEPMFEDASNMISRLPEIAAFIYRFKYKNGQTISPDTNLDFGGNFAHMMGIKKPYDDVARMYFILHSDHESGNVSAHTTHLVASALSDAYLSFSAGLNGLAGPLHGLANQEVLRWAQKALEKTGGKAPDKEGMKKFCWDTLNAGQVIPGYGHAVLRKTDPRFASQNEFCRKYLPNDELFKFVNTLYEVAPGVLTEHGKTKNPWPNVDAASGVIQWHYGLTEYDFYTVLFGIGRCLGVMANIVWDRGLGYALERPKSVTTEMLEKWAVEGGRQLNK